ncbi:hypothetical protein BKA56DRAFT_714943, partial [Ilyonectria sp. MPI-CAGE-AT-0026]
MQSQSLISSYGLQHPSRRRQAFLTLGSQRPQRLSSRLGLNYHFANKPLWQSAANDPKIRESTDPGCPRQASSYDIPDDNQPLGELLPRCSPEVKSPIANLHLGPHPLESRHATKIRPGRQIRAVAGGVDQLNAVDPAALGQQHPDVLGRDLLRLAPHRLHLGEHRQAVAQALQRQRSGIGAGPRGRRANNARPLSRELAAQVKHDEQAVVAAG